jgi:hypothetical protein
MENVGGENVGDSSAGASIIASNKEDVSPVSPLVKRMEDMEIISDDGLTRRLDMMVNC